MRILLIEDEPLIAFDLAAIVEGLGHEIVGVADSEAEAVNLASTLRLDAALVDVNLRDGFKGPQIVARLSAEFAVACAYVTGNPDQVTDAVRPIVTKPFSEQDVATVVERLAEAGPVSLLK